MSPSHASSRKNVRWIRTSIPAIRPSRIAQRICKHVAYAVAEVKRAGAIARLAPARLLAQRAGVALPPPVARAALNAGSGPSPSPRPTLSSHAPIAHPRVSAERKPVPFLHHLRHRRTKTRRATGSARSPGPRPRGPRGGQLHRVTPMPLGILNNKFQAGLSCAMRVR